MLKYLDLNQCLFTDVIVDAYPRIEQLQCSCQKGSCGESDECLNRFASLLYQVFTVMILHTVSPLGALVVDTYFSRVVNRTRCLVIPFVNEAFPLDFLINFYLWIYL